MQTYRGMIQQDTQCSVADAEAIEAGMREAISGGVLDGITRAEFRDLARNVWRTIEYEQRPGRQRRPPWL